MKVFNFSRKSWNQFYFIVSQSRIQQQAGIKDLLPQKHAPLPKNINRLKSQQISAGFSMTPLIPGLTFD
jgi:hypothetical protein